MEFARNSGGPILELACGTGRLVLPLAREGLDVTGLDANTQMLRALRTKLRKEAAQTRSNVHIVKGDMRTFKLNRKFSAEFIAFASFLHNATRADEEATLRQAYEHLRPDGVFAVEVFNPDLSRPQKLLRLDKVKHHGEETIIRFGSDRYDYKSQTIDATLIYDFVHRSGSVKRKVVNFPLRYVFKDELVGLLKRVGFAIEKVYGDFDKAPFEDNSPMVICVARRPA